MKAIVGFFLCLLIVISLHGQVADGVYLITQDESRPSVESQTGHHYRIGDQPDLTAAESSIYSTTNANDAFYLVLRFSYDSHDALSRNLHILVLDECGYVFYAGGSTADTHSNIYATVIGAEAKDKVATYFDCPVTYKKHPAHQFLIEFSTEKETYKSGEVIIATLQLTNVGEHPITFNQGGRYRGARNTQYIFSGFYRLGELLIHEPLIDIGTNSNMGGIAVPITLEPGEVFTDQVNLDKWFEMSKSGDYLIHASYFLEFVDPKTRSFENIWQDYVTGDFRFSVEEK